MFHNMIAFFLKIFDVHTEHLRTEAFHYSASAADKMGMVGVMGCCAHSIPEGPVSSGKTLNQAFIYQKVKDAIECDLIDGHIASNGCHNLDCRKGPQLISNGSENGLPQRGRGHTISFKQLGLVTTFTHGFLYNPHATELQALKSPKARFLSFVENATLTRSEHMISLTFTGMTNIENQAEKGHFWMETN
jgi:hypothetical protein